MKELYFSNNIHGFIDIKKIEKIKQPRIIFDIKELNEERKQYKKACYALSKKQFEYPLNYKAPKSFKECCGENHYVIDHKISLSYGFKKDIPIDVICHKSNMRLIKGIDNFKKGRKIFIDNENKWIFEKYR